MALNTRKNTPRILKSKAVNKCKKHFTRDIYFHIKDV